MSKNDENNTLQGWFDVTKLMGERAEARRQEWMAELGEPAFISNGFAFWRAAWGVLVIEKRPNGYHHHEARTFEEEFLNDLFKARELPLPASLPQEERS